MHRLASPAARSSSTLCLPGLPSASVATNFATDQQNMWKMLMDMQQQISFQTGLIALETATVAATAARGASDPFQGSGRPSGPPEPASVPNVRVGQSTSIQSKSCTTRRSSTLKNKPCSMKKCTKACEDTERD